MDLQLVNSPNYLGKKSICSSLLTFLVIANLLLFSGNKCQQQQFGNGQFIDNRLRGFNSIWSPAEILPNVYNNQQAPIVNGTPIRVEIDLHVQSIRPTNDQSVQRINILLTESWDDVRLQMPRGVGSNRRISLDRRWKDILWIPNLYFTNSIAGSIISGVDSSVYMILSNRTRVELFASMSLNILCSSDFSRYPFDEQDCSLEILPLSETSDSVVLRWNSMTMNPSSQESNLYYINFWTENRCRPNPIKGSSCIKGNLKLVRRIGSHLISHLLPTILMVNLSFGGFWIPLTAYSARIIIIVSSFLILIIHQMITSVNSPTTGGLWATNIWYTLCSLTIFGCLIEYLLALNESLIDSKPGDSGDSSTSSSWFNSKFFQSQPKIMKELLKPNDSNNFADMISRIAFPSVFLIITFVYILFYAI
ncbi:glycine receptor subunit alpha-2-like [Panonychus citri]|uniref:glycine receptor subunit alpha-2-like n=1 Tax=Panonychus citri TaxID=50023 RepID=UPI0023082A67|nr:glycine receptor subunit alpha-2-like [Panonychus citri]